jgi:uncharacterized protein YbjT (DUF2867 family)
MRITVFGSTGRTGKCVLAEALRRDHQVVAFTRRPDELTDSGSLAAVVHGDGRDPTAVRTAVAGADGVISIVAGGNRADPHRAAEVTRTIIAAMTGLGGGRLVVTSAYPIVADRPRLPIWLLRRVLATPYADVSELEQAVLSCDLAWTIARLNRLTDGPAVGTALTSRDLLAKPRSLTRADAAATLLDLVEDGALARTAVNIAGS